MRLVLSLLVLCLAVTAATCYHHATAPKKRTYYYPSGAIQEEYDFSANAPRHGMVRSYYEDGTLQRETEYSYGTWVRIRSYWPNGSLQELMNSDGTVERFTESP